MTIVAIGTYPGRAALGTVRISGPDTLHLLKQFLRPRKSSFSFAENPRVLTLCDLVDLQGSVVDESMTVFYKAQASYTGEDSAELTLHGNPIILRKAVEVLCSTGARLAEPGEFTSRAFRNGRMDLTKAESVLQLIDARSEYELSAARKLMGGELSRTISKFRSALIGLKAETEAEVDFSTEDLTFESLAKRKSRVK
ncbi:MAG: tRNA uridine-5-carboxymethylaminomethyl(34) synthesis GTPase MnmE, partial [Spirochaetia bacterium]|nr:tRNA uridine-5-carboxymethylaminomethyl(34) synthesis GTPase MnmE [Spirochaetia bacterium]